jgi:hypothetical protein
MASTENVISRTSTSTAVKNDIIKTTFISTTINSNIPASETTKYSIPESTTNPKTSKLETTSISTLKTNLITTAITKTENLKKDISEEMKLITTAFKPNYINSTQIMTSQDRIITNANAIMNDNHSPNTTHTFSTAPIISSTTPLKIVSESSQLTTTIVLEKSETSVFSSTNIITTTTTTVTATITSTTLITTTITTTTISTPPIITTTDSTLISNPSEIKVKPTTKEITSGIQTTTMRIKSSLVELLTKSVNFTTRRIITTTIKLEDFSSSIITTKSISTKSKLSQLTSTTPEYHSKTTDQETSTTQVISVLKKTFSTIQTENKTKSNNQLCCQTCSKCYHNISCCCPENSCHPISISCDTPFKNTLWIIDKINLHNPKYISVSFNFLVEVSFSNEFSETDISLNGDNHFSNITFQHPNATLSKYVFKAICNNSVEIFKSPIIIDGTNIQILNNIKYPDVSCHSNIIPCKYYNY